MNGSKVKLNKETIPSSATNQNIRQREIKTNFQSLFEISEERYSTYSVECMNDETKSSVIFIYNE